MSPGLAPPCPWPLLLTYIWGSTYYFGCIALATHHTAQGIYRSAGTPPRPLLRPRGLDFGFGPSALACISIPTCAQGNAHFCESSLLRINPNGTTAYRLGHGTHHLHFYDLIKTAVYWTSRGAALVSRRGATRLYTIRCAQRLSGSTRTRGRSLCGGPGCSGLGLRSPLAL